MAAIRDRDLSVRDLVRRGSLGMEIWSLGLEMGEAEGAEETGTLEEAMIMLAMARL